MALPVDVTDPGTVNVEKQAFGIGIPVDVTPGSDVAEQFATLSQTNVAGANFRPGLGAPVDVDPGDDVAEQSVAATPLTNVNGGSFKPGGVATTTNDPGMTNVEENPLIGLGLRPQVSGDASRPGRVPVDVTANNVAGQVYGTGTPANVNV